MANTSTGSAKRAITAVSGVKSPAMDTAWSVETSARQELVAKTDDIKRNLETVFDSQLFSKQEKREFRSVMHVMESKMSEVP